MAVIKLGNTKSAVRLINYCDRKAQERGGYNVDPDRAKEQFRHTREMWGKTEGVQAHHVMQSFKPGEIDPTMANEIGRKLAEKIAPNHEVMIYTHTDRDHIHNHLVVNAVSYQDGRKYHNDRAQLFKIREANDRLCLDRGLSVVQEPAKERFTMAEYRLVERSQRLWKDELRTAVDEARQRTGSLTEMRDYLKQTYGIETKLQQKNISFLHPEKNKYVRGKNLGEIYTKEEIERGFDARAREGVSRTSQPPTEPGRAGRASTTRVDEQLYGPGGVFKRGEITSERGDRQLRRGYKTPTKSTERTDREHTVSKEAARASRENPDRANQPGKSSPGRPGHEVKPSTPGCKHPEKGTAERVHGNSTKPEAHHERTVNQAGGHQHGQHFGRDNNTPNIPTPTSHQIINGLTKALEKEAKAQEQKTEAAKKHDYERQQSKQRRNRGQDHER